MRRDDTDDIKALLLARIDSLVQEIAPEGRRTGGYWMCRSHEHDRKLGGMWIKMTPGAPSPGVWRDEPAGKKGDVFNLIQYQCHLPDFPTTKQWSRAWLGLAQATNDDWKKRVHEARATQQAADTDADEKRASDAKRAKGLYLAAIGRKILGSPVDRYLQSRGISLAKLGRKPGALGWLPDGRHAESGKVWPVMVAGFTSPKNQIVAVHRTWIDIDGSGKAPVDPQRKIWPAFGGCAIRLWRGDSGLSIDDAAKHGLRETLVICEGVEDGLSVAMAAPEYRIWCAGSLGNVGAITLPECIDTVVVCADNDWSKPQAARQLEKSLAALARQGREVRVARSHVGKDVNDALRGGEG